MPSPDAAARLLQDWNTLCAGIGERRAGTDGEARAAAFIADSWRAAGLSAVGGEPVPCRTMRRFTARVQAPDGRRWRDVEAVPLVGSPSTAGRGLIEAPLAWMSFPESVHRLRPRSLRGRILALFGPLPTDAAAHRRLVAAEPLAVIHVDERLPFPWAKNDGMYPYWVEHYGVRPTLTVPYFEAWAWRRDGVARLRVQVATAAAAGTSQNVTGEIPGRDPRRPALLLGAHHDTQSGNAGADDNASGVVCLLELARRLGRGWRPARTIRFVSFGAEEQLSVGSAAYARAHRVTPQQVGLVVNLDSVASPLGHDILWAAGDDRLERFATGALRAGGIDVQVRREISPFFDHFPFNRAGIPSLTLMRENCSGGRWQHHSAHDNLDHISVPDTVRLCAALEGLVRRAGAAASLPFSPRLRPAQLAAARKLGRDLLGN